MNKHQGSIMEMMMKKLEEASIEGNVTALLELIKQDPLILDRQIVGCYNETPLHVSSLLGHLDFTNEILSRKSEMAVKTSTPTKSTPLHLAAAKGCLEIVKSLLKVHPDITCFAIDRDGYNPCHVAAMKGNMSVLKELVKVRASAVRAFVQKDGEKESILHLCVKYNQFEVLKFLVEIIGDDHDFVNFMDGDGSTILHLAVADKHIEVIKFILSNTKVEVNAKNANGYTALDILAQSRKDVNDMLIFESLQLVGALKARHLSDPLNHQVGQPVRIRIDHGDTHNDNHHRVAFAAKTDNWVEKKYNVLMLVALFIATMAFAAGINPIGGLWQDDFKGNTYSPPHFAGTSITADKKLEDYEFYVYCDTISFISALIVIVFLISGLPLKRRFYAWILMMIMWTAISTLVLTYWVALLITTSPERSENVSMLIVSFTIICVWFGLMGLLVLVHIIRLIVKAIKILVRFIRKRRAISRSSTTMNDNRV